MQGHPNIIQLKDVYEDSHHIYVITELCTGKELYQRIVSHKQNKNGQHGGSNQGQNEVHASFLLFEEAEAAQLIYNMISAIAYCHEVHGICHRDLQASNFMFSTTAEQKIMQDYRSRFKSFLHHDDEFYVIVFRNVVIIVEEE